MGLLFCDESLKEAYECAKHGVQMAPHLFQSRLLSGFRVQEDVDLTVINIPPIGSFPFSYKKLFSKTHHWGKNKQLGYLNIPLFKHFSQEIKLRKEIKKWLKAGEDSYIIAYSLYKPFIKVLHDIKKIHNVHVSLIQTDAVPGVNCMNPSRKAEKLGKKLIGYTKQFDSFVVLSKYLCDALQVSSRPSVITECICDTAQRPGKSKEKSDNIFLYTGTTAEIYGIRGLVDAFIKTPQAELWICGAGDSDEYIHHVSKEHSNIRHFGYLSQNEVANLRDNCDFLINPRRPTGTYTMYSFPSKTAEYLMSEKPVVMYKLEGIPDEYDAYITYLTGKNADKIAEEISSIINTDYVTLAERAKRARLFMLNSKTGKCQAKKIMDMLTQN